jgi:predicted AlkP superfamily phosphohydrolase/phosphomutase
MEREPWDVLMVHFIALDIMMHALWRFMDITHPRHEASPYQHAIREAYQLVDEYISKMLAQMPEDTAVLVMSDHGFGPLTNIVNLNLFLMDKGLLKLRRDPWTQLKSAAFRQGITPATVYRGVEMIGLQNMATRVSKNTRNNVVGKFLSFDSVDWSKSIAYSMGHVGQIYLNVAGREPHGIVTEYDYEEKRQMVLDALKDLKDKNGRPLITKIILREETYHGPYARNGPDIHLIIDDYNMIAFPLFATDNKILTQQIRGDSGCHRREGIFIAHGASIIQGGDMEEANILDLAPTIMHLMCQPVPRRMDGRVLTEIFDDPQEITYLDETNEEVGDSQALSDEDAAQVEERLRSLGYL